MTADKRKIAANRSRVPAGLPGAGQFAKESHKRNSNNPPYHTGSIQSVMKTAAPPIASTPVSNSKQMTNQRSEPKRKGLLRRMVSAAQEVRQEHQHRLNPSAVPIKGDVRKAAELADRLVDAARERHGLQVKLAPNGTDGIMNFKDREIAIRGELWNNPLESAETIVHELCHWFDPGRPTENEMIDNEWEPFDYETTREMEIVAAYATEKVCHEWGIDASERSHWYIENWFPGYARKGLPRSVIERGEQAANMVLAASRYTT